jgi:hypothetical protein
MGAVLEQAQLLPLLLPLLSLPLLPPLTHSICSWTCRAPWKQQQWRCRRQVRHQHQLSPLNC